MIVEHNGNLISSERFSILSLKEKRGGNLLKERMIIGIEERDMIGEGYQICGVKIIDRRHKIKREHLYIILYIILYMHLYIFSRWNI